MNSPSPLPRAVTETTLFIFTLGLAHFENWHAHDVAWSMWITSLITGLLFIYISILAGNTNFNKKGSSSKSASSGVFIALFFTFHFGFFHFVHSQFMISFFPLEGISSTNNFIDIVASTTTLYYGFILIGIARMLPTIFVHGTHNETELNMKTPYNFVIRNHVMIILLGGLSHFIEAGYIVYLVIIFYFFPFDVVFRKNKNSHNEEIAPPS